MFNPLNEKIALLLQEIAKLEAERDQTEKPIRDLYPLANQRPEIVASVRPRLEVVQRLNQTIDSKRQELIAAELLALDNSIKDLLSTTSQVDGSVKSLQSTTQQVDSSVKSLKTTSDKLLKSSNNLERLNLILIFTTILLAVIAAYQVTVTLAPTNPLASWIGVIGVPVIVVIVVLRLESGINRMRREQGETQ